MVTVPGGAGKGSMKRKVGIAVRVASDRVDQAETAGLNRWEGAMSEIVAVVETGVYVDDPDRAEAFYRDVLGLTVLGKEPGRHIFFRVGATGRSPAVPRRHGTGPLRPGDSLRGVG